MPDEAKKTEAEADPRRAEGVAKIAGGRYVVGADGKAARTEGPGIAEAKPAKPAKAKE